VKKFYVSVVTKATDKFFGGVFMEGKTELGAVKRAVSESLIPDDGVQCRVFEITEMPPAKYQGRVLTEEDLIELDQLDEN
jgi:hypothetical protein